MIDKAAALVVLALGALPACGLAPHDHDRPALPGDGVTGFSPVGPIQFCIKQALVVAPAVAVGNGISVCVPDSRQPSPCAADADCTAPEQCDCGRCVVHACSISALGCADQQVCVNNQCTTQCLTDSDCAAGFTCRGGGCARPCNGDGDCPYGELCDTLSNVCHVNLCGSFGQNCANGEHCEGLEEVGEIHEPLAVSTPQGERYYLELRQGANASIYRARAEEQLYWVADPADPVLSATEPSDKGAVGAPAIAREGSEWVLYFVSADGASIDRATSTDGVQFKRDANPALVANAKGWESGRVSSPSVVALGGESYLLYEGGQGAGIGVATLAGGRATRLGSSPVIDQGNVQDPVFWRGISRVGTPDAVLVGDVVRIYFTARGTEGGEATQLGQPRPADPNDSIGMFTTRDFKHFDAFPDGPVYARRTNIRSYLGESEPFVSVGTSRTLMYYVTSDASGAVSGVALAASN
jgi:hypothetical protein